jgi:hypothetical protein
MIAASSSTSRFVLHVVSSYARRFPLMAPTPPAPPAARGRGGATAASLPTVVLTVPPPSTSSTSTVDESPPKPLTSITSCRCCHSHGPQLHHHLSTLSSSPFRRHPLSSVVVSESKLTMALNNNYNPRGKGSRDPSPTRRIAQYSFRNKKAALAARMVTYQNVKEV